MTNAAGGLWTSCCDAALDWVFPGKCALCRRLADTSPCEVCRSEMPAPKQALVFDPGSPLRFRACGFEYEGKAAEAVRRLKYNGSTSMARYMAETVRSVVYQMLDPGALIVPVPIHGSRRAERGFNQAEFLCEACDRGSVRSDLLKRVRATRPQAGLSAAERATNLTGAFWASPAVAGKTIVLVDDVVTSGSTARECAGVLIQAGAASVGVASFAGQLT